MTNPKWFDQTTSDVRRHEGCRLKSYWDPIGKCWTIGYGHTKNVVGNMVITQEKAEEFLDDDMWDALNTARKLVPTFDSLDSVRKTVVLNMSFNLGYDRLSEFKKFLAALAVQDFKRATLEMLNSRWAAQVKGRSIELAKRMQTGELDA